MDTNKGTVKRVHPPAFKAKVAIEAIKEHKTIAELSSAYGIHSTQITKWKKKALEFIQEIFSDKFQAQKKNDDDLIQELYKQLGKLTVERDWLKKKIGLIEDNIFSK